MFPASGHTQGSISKTTLSQYPTGTVPYSLGQFHICFIMTVPDGTGTYLLPEKYPTLTMHTLNIISTFLLGHFLGSDRQCSGPGFVRTVTFCAPGYRPDPTASKIFKKSKFYA
jgi:hypothetical protein